MEQVICPQAYGEICDFMGRIEASILSKAEIILLEGGTMGSDFIRTRCKSQLRKETIAKFKWDSSKTTYTLRLDLTEGLLT